MWLWAVIIAMLMVIGSALWIMPSRWERHVARLRQQAIVGGASVRLMQFPLINAEGRVIEAACDGAAYLFEIPPQEHIHAGWMLVRNQSDVDTDANFTGWGWYICQHELPESIMKLLAELVNEMEEYLYAVSISANSIGLGWNEKGDHQTFQRMQYWADSLKQLIGEIES